jgi:hypothetical protein
MLESCEKKDFIIMDVTFRELKSYYSSEMISPFGDSLTTGGLRREGESSSDGDCGWCWLSNKERFGCG